MDSRAIPFVCAGRYIQVLRCFLLLKISLLRCCTLHGSGIQRYLSLPPLGVVARFVLKARCRRWRLRIVSPHLPCAPSFRACLLRKFQPAMHVTFLSPTNTRRHPQVTGMLDESKGTLRLARDGLGDERVPSLTLERLKEMYRTGRGSVCSWRATASLANRGAYLNSCRWCCRFVICLAGV